MTPQYRFTFFNSVLSPGGTVVAQPVGWKDASISLTRDPNYHSLVEFFKGSFIWYGTARQFIRDVEDTQGPDAQIQILIELSYDGLTFEEVFDGTVDVSQIEDMALSARFYKSVIPVVQNDFWVKFLNRVAIPVNLQASVSLDGGAVTAIPKTTLPLPSQVLKRQYSGQLDTAVVFQGPIAGTDYVQVDMDNELISEIKEKFTLPTDINTSIPVNIFTIDEDGEYTFDLLYEFSHIYSAGGSCTPPAGPTVDPDLVVDSAEGVLDMFIKINDAAPTAFTETNSPLVYTERSTQYSYAGTLTLKRGDLVTIYGDMLAAIVADYGNLWLHGVDNSGTVIYQSGWALFSYPACSPIYGTSLETITPPSAEPIPTYVRIVGNTTTPDTSTDAYFVKDAAESIITKLVGQNNALVSDYLDTCAGENMMMRGKHVRGYLFSEKEYALSFEEWWACLEPMYNLGLGYEKIAGVSKIRIEQKEYYYNPTPVVYLSNVSNIVRTYDLDRIFKSIEIGTEKWSAESSGGIDDPQTKRYYDTSFKTIGKDVKILSKAILASLAIEQTRRNRAEFGKDWKLDEDNVVIAVIDDSGYRPEVGADFNSVTGLENPDTRINIRHAPGYMLQRWKKWLAGCLQTPGGSSFMFRRGEGNYAMVSELDAAQCEYGDIPEVDEGANVPAGDEYTFLPKLYKAKIPMSRNTYNSILANKNNALGISSTTSNYLAMHIIDMDYKIVKGYAELLLLQANETVLNP